MTSARRTTTPAQRVAAVVVGVLVAVPVALVALLVVAAPAEATTYRYWTYWWGADTGKSSAGWSFAKVGPAGHSVQDTWVLGWRFATSRSTTASTPPRHSSTFASLCPDLAPTAGSMRVALVVDYGTVADAPPGQTPPTTSSVRVECVTVPAGTTGAGVLRAATPPVLVRTQNGLICALDGYPRNECAPVVPDPAPAPTPKRTAAPTPARPAPVARSTPATSATTSSSGGSVRPPTGPASHAATAAAVAASGSPSTTASSSGAVAPPTSAGGSPDPSESKLPAVAGSPVADGQSSGSPVGLAAGGLVIAVIAASAWRTSRRGRQG